MKTNLFLAAFAVLAGSASLLAQAPASQPASAPASQPAGEVTVIYHCNFDQGLPEKWAGVPVKENLPPDSKGAVTAQVTEGAAAAISSSEAWVEGHFTTDTDLFVNFRMKMAKPEWFQFFLFLKDKGPEASNNLLYEGKPSVEGLQAGEWKVVSIPLSDFKCTMADKAGTPPAAGQICWRYFWDTQKRDLGLTIDRIWITKGKPGTTPPPAK